jgi:hypothetical protein
MAGEIGLNQVAEPGRGADQGRVAGADTAAGVESDAVEAAEPPIPCRETAAAEHRPGHRALVAGARLIRCTGR